MANKLTKDLEKKLEKKLQTEADGIKSRIEDLKKSDPFADPEHAIDNAAIDTDVREQIGHDTIEAEIKDLQKRLNNIDLAFKRIKKNKYGICEGCNNLIPLPRLKLVPEARFCIKCEQSQRI